MGEGDQRSPKQAAHYLRRVLVQTSKPRDAAEPDAATAPAANESAEALVLPRTTTLDDPLTTSLLAEVARRSRTIDVSPDQIADAMDANPVPDDSDLPAPAAPTVKPIPSK